jgi:hypothetical protein
LQTIFVGLGDDNEHFETMVNGIINAREYYEKFVTVLQAGECRIMCAGSSVYREDGQDDGEA